MATDMETHWAICDERGAVLYDEFGRAFVYFSRGEARRNRDSVSLLYDGENVRIQKVKVDKL